MKQVLQNLGDGQTIVADVPCPVLTPGSLQILTTKSLVSAGTERMLVSFGRANLLSKMRQQPDKVRQTLEKIRTDGLITTVEAVRAKLDQPLAPGYCNVGRVLVAGSEAAGFAVGQRVVSNGRHAEVVVVPRNLCARIPDAVDDEDAAFTVLAAIGLQGVRLVAPTLGEAIVVTGLGLIGLITVQILRANGCRVLGIDMDPARVQLARQFGAEGVDLSRGEDPVRAAESFARGHGVDAVILTASTSSSEPVAQAAAMCRKRGRIVLVGVTGLELSRADFYEKELSFQVSCSYGPGRYDPDYEEGGHDYPIGFVRWTEQRNFEAVLDLMASRVLDMKPLVSHRFTLDSMPAVYELLASGEPSLGILIDYGNAVLPAPPQSRLLERTLDTGRSVGAGQPSVALIGAGNYAGRILVPAFKRAGASLHTIVSASGVTAAHHGAKHGFQRVSTDATGAIHDPAVRAVVVATRHDSHARYVVTALAAGKHVFVEKPLCLTLDELESIAAHATAGSLLMVGFNRRFAPQVRRIRTLLAALPGPKAFVMTVNAGAIPAAHWTQDLASGGGRLLGEGCHFIDLLRHLAGESIVAHDTLAMDGATRDSAIVNLKFADGSIGTIQYLANGGKAFQKERLEVFAAGRSLRLDNFRRLTGFNWPGFSSMNLWRQDKGQRACVQAFVDAVRTGGPLPIALAEILEVARVSIEVQQTLR